MIETEVNNIYSIKRHASTWAGMLEWMEGADSAWSGAELGLSSVAALVWLGLSPISSALQQDQGLFF